MTPRRPCQGARCHRLTRERYCTACAPRAWTQTHATPTPRVRGRRLQALRAALFATEPICRACRAQGRATPAVIRDHVIPLAEGGTDDDANVQPLCQRCSDSKTQQESARGRASR